MIRMRDTRRRRREIEKDRERETIAERCEEERREKYRFITRYKDYKRQNKSTYKRREEKSRFTE